MRTTLIIALILGVTRLLRADAEPPRKRPNIIFILVDDMGYGDAGCFWQDARAPGAPRLLTPALDLMARQGMRLTSHYSSAPVCAPSRASLLQGLNQGHCDLRDNEFDKPLVPGPTLGSVMQAAGYYTAAIGKWGVGGTAAPWPGHPLKRGFNEYYGFLRHGQAHNHYADNNGAIYDGYTSITHGLDHDYDNDLFTARAKKMIEDHLPTKTNRPFFLYLAFTLPHYGMQLPPGAYPAGGGVHGGVQWPLNESQEQKNSYVYPEFRDKDWPANEKCHASMIHRIDDNVGDLFQLLRDLHIDDNTLVVFTSDNGPHNEGNDPRFFASWGPFDGIKRDLFEGGMREPTIIRWPGHIPPNRSSDLPSVQYDWMATFTNLAGLPAPALSDGISMLPTLLGHPAEQRYHPYLYFEYHGTMTGPITKEILARHGYTARGEEQAVRVGDLVGVRYDIHAPADPLELYDIKNDLQESRNLAGDKKYAATLQQMRDLLVTSRDPVADAPRPYDDVPMPAVPAPEKVGGLSYRTFSGHWPWLPDFQTMHADRKGVTSNFATPKASGAELAGFVNVPADGKYLFMASSDVDLWIHDALVIRDTDSGDTGEVRLKAGWHPLRLATSDPGLKLILSGPVAQVITPAMLGYNPNNAPDVHPGLPQR